MNAGRRLRIAVGVIFNQGRDHVLLAKRPANVHLGGLWEFPGGKCRAGECAGTALERELLEELDIEVLEARPFMVIDHDYADEAVKLDVFLVPRWSGREHGKEGQFIEWVSLDELEAREFPAANQEIVRAVLEI